MEFTQTTIATAYFSYRKFPKSTPWTAEEDQFLMREAEIYEFKSWKNVAKKVNRHFSGSYKSFHDCRKRALWLIQEQTAKLAWSPNEDFVLLLAYFQGSGKWSAVWKCLPKRRKTDIKIRFHQILLDVGNKISAKKGETPSKCETPFEKFAIQLCSLIAVKWLENDEISSVDREAGKIISGLNMTSKDWLEKLAYYLDIVGNLTEKSLESYIEDVLEKIGNEMIEIQREIEDEKEREFIIPISELKKVHYAIQD